MNEEEIREHRIEVQQENAKADIKIVKRDFYDDVPQTICNVLDNIYWRWKKYDWFEEAWNKYRDKVIDAKTRGVTVEPPSSVFNPYIDEQVKDDFLKEEKLYNYEGCSEAVVHNSEVGEKFIESLLNKDENSLEHRNYWHYKKGSGKKGFAPVGDPDAEPEPGWEQKQEEEKISNERKRLEAQQEKERADQIEKFKKENADFKVIKEYNDNLKADEREAKKASEEDFKRTAGMLQEGRNITTELANIAQERRGTKRVNPKETKIKDNRPYIEISDEELNKRVRRMQLERQYGDLTGDTVYEQTGREKTREYLQTIGSLLGIALSALTIYKYIKSKK